MWRAGGYSGRLAGLAGYLKLRTRTFRRDRSGNIALSFAFLSVTAIIAIGSCFDYVTALNTRTKMQSDLDAAVIAAVKQVGTKDDAAIKKQVGDWLEAQAEIKGYYVLNTSDVAIDATNSAITAKASATVPTTLMTIVGVKSIPVSVRSTVAGGKDAATQNAFSMYMVLDRSGSMADSTDTSYTTTCYLIPLLKLGPYQCTKKYTKLESLKLAVGNLTNQLAVADPASKYVRTGAVSFNDLQQTPSPLDWGVAGVNTYVNNLTATGNTNSSDAMATAYNALMQSTEASLHKAKNGATKPSKYIVFMTDGDNNYTTADTETKKWCDQAKQAGIEVYSVAFMAPSRGQSLLSYCATTSAHYFKAEDADDLNAAFQYIGERATATATRLTQ